MTELGFLLELLINHRLPKTAKDLILTRIKEVEARQVSVVQRPVAVASPTAQAASTQAILDRNPDLIVAQTPAAQAAMASRQIAIAESLAGKVDKTTGRPRKF